MGTRNTLVGLSFILPSFIGLLVFVLIPVLFSFILAFMDWDGFNEMTFVGSSNFLDIFGDRAFKSALIKTFAFTIVTTLLTTFAALGLAVLLNKKLRFKNFFRSAIFFPYFSSMASIAVVWKLLFMKDIGPINQFLGMLGVANPPGWLASTDWALPAVMIVYIWKYMGYYMIVYLAALQDIPIELYEAASIDGADGFQYFWRVMVPMLMPATFFVVLMLTIESFKSFDLVFAMTEGGPGTATTLLSNFIYNKAFISFDYGVTSAASFVLFAIIAVITLFQLHIEKKMSN
ncbi:MAG: sugar ABC transporter permease [Clostridiales bacterium]|jgi:ABC-type sugar transport system permease subunit|nr:sugar ABC transporter permease [Clostridiales bacterium]